MCPTRVRKSVSLYFPCKSFQESAGFKGDLHIWNQEMSIDFLRQPRLQYAVHTIYLGQEYVGAVNQLMDSYQEVLAGPLSLDPSERIMKRLAFYRPTVSTESRISLCDLNRQGWVLSFSSPSLSYKRPMMSHILANLIPLPSTPN